MGDIYLFKCCLQPTPDPRYSLTTPQIHLHVKVKSLSRVRLFVTPWTVAYQASPSMGFSRQEYWSGLLFPSPGDLPDPGIKPGSPALQAEALTSEPPGKIALQLNNSAWACRTPAVSQSPAFVNKHIGAQPHPFISVLSTVAHVLQHEK